MGKETGIAWTDHTFNPHRGCTKVSAGCTNCYADALSARNPRTLGVWGPKGTRVVAAESYWREPVKWNAAAEKAGVRKRVFCASLADVFEDWTNPMSASDGAVMHVCAECGEWRTMEKMCHGPNAHLPLTMAAVRERLFALIGDTPNLDWLILTKRPENIERFMWPGSTPLDPVPVLGGGDYFPNLWAGTSVENKATLPRIDILRGVTAAVRFLSVEPLLEDLGTLDLTGISWVIVGGESGGNARPFHLDWARSIIAQCKAASVPVFCKQLGSVPQVTAGEEGIDYLAGVAYREQTVELGKPATLKLKDKKGGTPAEWPSDLQIREFPAA
jgi:protein gp37